MRRILGPSCGHHVAILWPSWGLVGGHIVAIVGPRWRCPLFRNNKRHFSPPRKHKQDSALFRHAVFDLRKRNRTLPDSVAVVARRHTGTRTHWYTGEPMHKYTQTSAYWYTETPAVHEPLSVLTHGTPVRQYTGTPVHWYTGTPIHWCTSTPVHRYTGTPVHRDTDTLIHWYTSTLVNYFGVCSARSRKLFWDRLGALSGVILGLSSSRLVALWGPLGISWGLFGLSWGHVAAVFEPSGAIWG